MSKIKQNVMYSVGVIYILRKVLSPIAIKVYAFLLSTIAIAQMVSIPDVLSYFMSVGLAGAGAFLVEAIVATSVTVQVVTAVVVILGVLLVRDSFRVSGAGSFN